MLMERTSRILIIIVRGYHLSSLHSGEGWVWSKQQRTVFLVGYTIASQRLSTPFVDTKRPTRSATSETVAYRHMPTVSIVVATHE